MLPADVKIEEGDKFAHLWIEEATKKGFKRELKGLITVS